MLSFCAAAFLRKNHLLGNSSQGSPCVLVRRVCFLVRGVYGGRLRGIVALKVFCLEGEGVGNPLCALRHRKFLEGGCRVLRVCDGWVVEVEEVDGRLCGCGPGL